MDLDLLSGKLERKSVNPWFCLGFGLFEACIRFNLLYSLHRIPETILNSFLR